MSEVPRPRSTRRRGWADEPAADEPAADEPGADEPAADEPRPGGSWTGHAPGNPEGGPPQGPPDEHASDERRSLLVPYRVRFDESTPSGTVRVSALLRYAQDCAWAHSERLGFGRDWYAERGLFWLVRAVELRLLGAMPTGTIAAVRTTVVGFRHVLARRRTTIQAPDGRIVASIDTDWAMVGNDGVPTRIPVAFPSLFGGIGERFRPNRIALPPAGSGVTSLDFAARPQELDPMGHANNAVYLDWLEEAVVRFAPQLLGLLPRTYRLEYLLPARPGVDLQATAWATGEDAVAYRLVDPAGDLFRATLEG